jgi:hypothetical protein
MNISKADFPNSPQPTENTTGAYATRSVDTDDPVQGAIERLTEWAEKGGGASGTESARGAGRIEGAIALYGLMEEGEVRSVEELRERMRESGNDLLEGLAEDAEWIAELDAAGHGGKQNGVVSREAVGDYLQSIHQRVENILDGELTDGDYEDLKALNAQAPETGQGVLGELSYSQREDLSHRIAADPELLGERDDLTLQASAYDYEAALEQARELAPSGDSDLQGDVAGILYGSLTERNYQDLKDLFAKDPEVGAKVLEIIAPLQEELAERLGGDKRLRWDAEDQPEGFKALLSASLGASRQLLDDQGGRGWHRPYTPDNVAQLQSRVEQFLEESEPMIQQLQQIAAGPEAFLQEDPGEPQPEVVAGVVDAFQGHAAQILSTWNEALDALMDAEMEMNLAQAGDEFSAAPIDPEESYKEYATAYASIMGLWEDRESISSVMGLFENFNAALLDALGGASSPQNEAGPSDLTLIHVPLVLPNGETQDFYVHEQEELESELRDNAAFRAWASEYHAGWSLVGLAAHVARLLLEGRGLPR